MGDYQFLDHFKKKRVKIALKCASYFGTIQRVNLNKTILLEDVVDVKTGRELPGVKLFFGHEIQAVEFLLAKQSSAGGHGESAEEKGSDLEEPKKAKGQLTVAEFQPYRRSLVLDDEEDSEFVDYVVIDQFHEKFGPAIMHIQTQKVIGLGADGVGISQHERLCWLQIATKNKVYLFDILLLGARAFKNGLSMIMENNRILKVVHDCRGISGTLHHQFGVNLANVFDTQVADVLFFYTEMGGMLPDQVSTLQESIALHLQIPPSRLASLKIKMDLTKEESEVWYVRPCPVSFLKVMALSVIHLQPLRLVLLDALMSDYVTLVNSYLALWREEPVDLQIGCENTGTELPKELRELVNMQHERQERALEKYNVNEEGLLLRSSPKSTVNPSGCSAQPPRESKPKDLKTDWETSANNRQNRDGRDSCREESKSTRVGEGCFISKAAEQTDAKTVGAQAARDSGPAAASTRDNADPMKRISPSAKPDLPGGNPETKTCGDRGKKDTEEGLGSRSEASRAIEIAVDRPVEIGKASTLERDKLPLTYFTIGRGLSLQKSTGVSTEFPAVGKPQSVGGAAEAGAPGSLREESGKGVDNQHAGGGKPRGAERGTLSPNILSFGRGFFFQKP